MSKTVGSVCSGIEAASVAWEPLGFQFEWFSEISLFPSKVLEYKYPKIKNHGDMTGLARQITSGEIAAPDIICGGTPCQAFSYAGWKAGLNDTRGNLTLCFVEIVNANDDKRAKKGQPRSIVFWENVEGVLSDKTNAFGAFLSYLAGFNDILCQKQWPSAGVLKGPIRNIAWRVLDAKYFGVPHQRRRLYVLAGGKDFMPENIIFEDHINEPKDYPSTDLVFEKDSVQFEVFRSYTDCLYSAYGTKWNGNAAANNGSLFVVESGRLRRFSPLECERLMGLPDNYTNIPGNKKTNRYQAIGNSWAVPVISFIGRRVAGMNADFCNLADPTSFQSTIFDDKIGYGNYFDFSGGISHIGIGKSINCTPYPEKPNFANIRDIVSPCEDESIFISPVGCYGIIRRSKERNTVINSYLKSVLEKIADQMPKHEIEKKSLLQTRGKFAKNLVAG